MEELEAALALEDGAIFYGKPFGSVHSIMQNDRRGEVVFATAMTGYQEICTDPSYRGQMVVMTYPLIGNYGVSAEDVESRRPWLAALIVREICEEYSNWRAVESISSYLNRYNIPGITDIDTRALTRHLRTYGTKRGIIRAYTLANKPSEEELIHQAQQVKPITDLNVVGEVSLTEASCWQPSLPGVLSSNASIVPYSLGEGNKHRVVVIDTGFKQNIARCLADRELEVVLVPHAVTAEELFALHPQGVLLSNGPGDPETVQALVDLTKDLITSGIPVMGICLGHQVIGLAAGAQTSRLPFGHHGSNHPVKDLRTGRVTITSQNHNFQVEAATIPPQSGFHVSHINLLDNSVEGLYHDRYPIFSVQYHPEASPGPRDNQYLFDDFAALVKTTASAVVA